MLPIPRPRCGILREPRSKRPAIMPVCIPAPPRLSADHVFGMFMDRYDTFWLSQAPRVRLPGGEPCFPGVPERSPQAILAAHGLKADEAQTLDPAGGVSVTPWRRVT